jgi:hypothetical protein
MYKSNVESEYFALQIFNGIKTRAINVGLNGTGLGMGEMEKYK